MAKDILIAAYSLGLGGIETSLVTLLKELEDEYNITLILEKKEGIFLKEVSPKVKILQYSPCDCKIVFLRKVINMFKQTIFKLKYKNKYNCAISYATYSLSSGFVARTASKNSVLWVHADYLSLNNGNEIITKQYYESLKCNDFKKIVFVSKEARNNFIKLFPEMKNKVFNCNNLIDGNKILGKSKENIEKEDLKKINYVSNETIFLNVGRHDERQKRLTRIIEVAEKLKNDNLNFKILFVGDGQDSILYKKQVKEKKLEDKIIFLGKKQNPYPYYKTSDYVILTSDYEGYPVVFLESMILDKPILTTKLSDYDEIEGKFGIVTSKDIGDIYDKMKQLIEKGFEIKEKFDFNKYNNEIKTKLKNIINDNL